MTRQIKQKDEAQHIMVVDDESHVGLFIETLLLSRGFEVTRYCDSKEALTQFTAQPWLFDVVVTDQNMPNMCGTELAKRLLSIRSNMPIILCSGSVNEDMVQAISDMGILAYLPKPLQVNELLNKIDRLRREDCHQHKPVTGD